MFILYVLLGTVVLLMSCAAKSERALSSLGIADHAEIIDLRRVLLEVAKQQDPEFPNNRDVLLTHFSHVGELMTETGKTIYVADQQGVIGGMPAPRGLNRILFFNSEFQYLGNVGYVQSRPLWCEGSKLYLFGELDGLATGLEGNVLDVSKGFAGLKGHSVHACGSSGGIEERDDAEDAEAMPRRVVDSAGEDYLKVEAEFRPEEHAPVAKPRVTLTVGALSAEEGKRVAILQLRNNGVAGHFNGPYIQRWDGMNWVEYVFEPALMAEFGRSKRLSDCDFHVPFPAKGPWRAYVSVADRLRGIYVLRSRVLEE